MWFNPRNKETIKRAMQHSNLVINLVGKHWETRNFSFYDTNVVIPATIAAAAKECGVERFIHISSAGASPDSPSGFSRSKALGEQAVRDIFPEATIFRPCVLFGRQDRLLQKYAVMHTYWKPRIRVCKHQKLQPLWVSDLATAIMNTLPQDELAGKTLNIGGPEVMTVEDLTQFIAETILSRKHWMDVPRPFMMPLAAIWEKILRVPRMTTDELVFMANHDSVVPAGARNALYDLGVTSPSRVEDVALSMLRVYREPAFQNLVT